MQAARVVNHNGMSHYLHQTVAQEKMVFENCFRHHAHQRELRSAATEYTTASAIGGALPSKIFNLAQLRLRTGDKKAFRNEQCSTDEAAFRRVCSTEAYFTHRPMYGAIFPVVVKKIVFCHLYVTL